MSVRKTGDGTVHFVMTFNI